MTITTTQRTHSKAAFSEPHQWLKSAIDENHIKFFDYSNFRDFEFLASGGFGKVEKAIFDSAGTKLPYALKRLYHLQDVNIEKKGLIEFIREASCKSFKRIVYFRSTISQ